MVKRKFKYEAGAATQFISRRKARKSLQISLADFRRLCILKGIYPHEPKNKKQVNKGSTAPKTFYFKKDIDFLAHEPLIQKFRKHKATIKKLKRARGRKDYDKAEQIRSTFDQYTVDHIVLERYPNFIDAIRDLDDAITLVCLFATFPQSRKVHSDMVRLCRRLKYEFLNYCIETKAIRKCFISIKGIYLQAEIQNELITWVMPHCHAYSQPSEVDFRVLQTFADFYTHLVGFTLAKLYNKEKMIYPPQAVRNDETELGADNKLLIENLCHNLVKSGDAEADDANEEGGATTENPEQETEELDEKQKEIIANEKKLKELFKDKVFNLGRETPKEILTILIRACGGKVSDNVDDSKITHQISDRGAYTDMKYAAQRSYLQPQWIFDSVNARFLLPLERFLPNSELPAHLSPFVEEKENGYRPPERVELEAMARGEDPGLIYGKTVPLQQSSSADVVEDDLAPDEESDFDSEDGEDSEDDDVDDEDKPEVDSKQSKSDPPQTNKAKKAPLVAKVKPGSKDAPKGKFKDQDEAEEKRLAKQAMPKKIKRLHDKIEYGQRKERRENENLAKKRKLHDEEKSGSKPKPAKKEKKPAKEPKAKKSQQNITQPPERRVTRSSARTQAKK